MSDEVIQPPVYKDDDLVYVDPLKKIVVGIVEFLPNGKAKKLPMIFDAPEVDEMIEKDDKEKPKRGPRRERYYPWGTYRSMKRVYKIEGKIPKYP